MTACYAPPDPGARTRANGAKAKGGTVNTATKTAATPARTGPPRVATAPSHGFNDAIAWRSLADGFKEAKVTGMPMMLVVHADWCPKCKSLKRTFADPTLVEASQDFVMVNVDQDETPEAMLHAPDGTYIPRVLFFGPDGSLDPSLQNPARPTRFRYFYTPADDLVAAMGRAMGRLGTQVRNEKT